MAASHIELSDELIASRILLDQIADKWSVFILSTICQGPARFNALKRSLPGVSQKALTQALRRLERNGILKRHVVSISPVAVEYHITPLGMTLKKPFAALHDWTRQYASDVESARAEYDRGTQAESAQAENGLDAPLQRSA